MVIIIMKIITTTAACHLCPVPNPVRVLIFGWWGRRRMEGDGLACWFGSRYCSNPPVAGLHCTYSYSVLQCLSVHCFMDIFHVNRWKCFKSFVRFRKKSQVPIPGVLASGEILCLLPRRSVVAVLMEHVNLPTPFYAYNSPSMAPLVNLFLSRLPSQCLQCVP